MTSRTSYSGLMRRPWHRLYKNGKCVCACRAGSVQEARMLMKRAGFTGGRLKKGR